MKKGEKYNNKWITFQYLLQSEFWSFFLMPGIILKITLKKKILF